MSITMEACGAATTVQDLGRYGHLASGVGISGAFDQHALALANRLVGNQVSDAGLEVLGGGVRIAANRATVAAVTGARGPITVNERVVARNVPVVMRSGDVLAIAHPTAGLRSYVAFAGGINATAVLGSRSRDTLAQLGPAPLAAGDVLALGHHLGDVPSVDIPIERALAHVLRVLPGPHARYFYPDALTKLTSHEYEVSSHSDRIGVRFIGPALARIPDMELPSAPMVRGAIQVPPDGAPVMLGPDHPVTGGYPVIAVTVRSSIDAAAQLTPGQIVRFILA